MNTIYAPSDVSKQLGIKQSTLRKYSIILEQHGYTFRKNEKQHRAYYDGDVMAIRKLLQLKNNSDMTLETAANSVVSWSKGEVVLQEVASQNERHAITLNDLQASQKKQMNLIENLIKHNARMEEIRQKTIQDLIEENKQLRNELNDMKTVMNELQATNKEIAVAIQKRTFLQRLFNI